MLATDLSGPIWNAIADLVARSQAPREIYFCKVKKADKKKLLIWAEDFGDIAIPLVALPMTFAHFDTVSDIANLGTGAISSHKEKREDRSQTNPAFFTQVVCPKAGETVIVLDPWGAKRFPLCIGVILSKPGFWEED